MRRSIGLSLISLWCLALVAACGSDTQPTPSTTVPTSTTPVTTPGGMGDMGGGTANPAAVFCGVQSGTYNADDETCTLPNGQVVDSWALFRGETEGKTQIANPAAVFCAEQGGTHDLDTGTCTLPDGTVKDAWDYFRENH